MPTSGCPGSLRAEPLVDFSYHATKNSLSGFAVVEWINWADSQLLIELLPDSFTTLVYTKWLYIRRLACVLK